MELLDFLENQMSMSHIYQPVVIRTLLENGGTSSIRNLAKEFLAYDEAQVSYYMQIVKRWPKITLKKHGVIDTSKRGYFQLSFSVESLSEEQKENLIELCNQKISDYVKNYKGIIGDYRFNPENLSSHSIRYLVLKLAKGRCALCGASIKDTPIDIDHIIPRSKGGDNSLGNLQALCFRCNRAKGNKDNEDFRLSSEDTKPETCIFCHDLEGRIQGTYNSAVYIHDRFPVTELHSLIIPSRHVSKVRDLSASELQDIFFLAKYIQSTLESRDAAIGGFNLGINEGGVAGQTVDHLHMHVIPRRKGDVSNPIGGIRWVVPDRAIY